MKLLISLNSSVPRLLYKSVELKDFQKYLDKNILPAKKWKRYIEEKKA